MSLGLATGQYGDVIIGDGLIWFQIFQLLDIFHYILWYICKVHFYWKPPDSHGPELESHAWCKHWFQLHPCPLCLRFQIRELRLYVVLQLAWPDVEIGGLQRNNMFILPFAIAWTFILPLDLIKAGYVMHILHQLSKQLVHGKVT